MSLFSLVYVSIASKEMSDNDLLAILEKAKKHNTLNAITGMLLYRDGFFIQALEGQESIVDNLFERIKQDKLHYNVLQIYRKPTDRRYFSQWAMGFATPNLDTLKQTIGFSDFMQQRQINTSDELATSFENEVEDLLNTFRS